jgi:hypothetical protein
MSLSALSLRAATRRLAVRPSTRKTTSVVGARHRSYPFFFRIPFLPNHSQYCFAILSHSIPQKYSRACARLN